MEQQAAARGGLGGGEVEPALELLLGRMLLAEVSADARVGVADVPVDLDVAEFIGAVVTERRRRGVTDVEVGRLLHQVTGLGVIRPDQRQDVNDLDGDVVTVLGAVRVLDDDGQRVRSSLLPASREQPVDRIVVRADIPGVAHRGDEHQIDLVVDVHQIGAHVEDELANLCIIRVGRLQAHIGK